MDYPLNDREKNREDSVFEDNGTNKTKTGELNRKRILVVSLKKVSVVQEVEITADDKPKKQIDTVEKNV